MTTQSIARNDDLLVAIRGAGHNGAGLGTCDDGLVIDLLSAGGAYVDSMMDNPAKPGLSRRG
jgi:hypothetical protein